MTEADPFSCFGSPDDESDGDEKQRAGPGDTNTVRNVTPRKPELVEQGRRMAEAANARQSNVLADHAPLSSTGYEIYSCADQDGYGGGQMGMRAVHAYSAGDEILRERPAMRICTAHAATSRSEAEEKFEVAVQEAFDLLTPQTAQSVMDLSSCQQQEEGVEKTAVGIFQTNSYQLGDEKDYGGLFVTISRMNHSCRPNATHHWRPDLHMMVVHAARDIVVGEELCTCYGPGDCRVTEGRRSYLRDRYSFECACEMCREGNDTGGDDRMAEIGEFIDDIGLYTTAASEPQKLLQGVDRCLELLKEQGIGGDAGPYAKNLLHYGYQICLRSLQNEAMAHSYLTRELISVNCSEGPGSYKAVDIQKMLDEMNVQSGDGS